MTIEKSTLTPGWYVATYKKGFKFFVGSGKTQMEALSNLIEKIEWCGILNN